MDVGLAIAAGYLIGGIPFSFLIVRLVKGIDLRTVGSGNVGATNACRVFPGKWRIVAFIVCFSLDALKGYVSAGLFGPILIDGSLGGWSPSAAMLLPGIAAIAGHMWTPYLRFKGGKGVATALGVYLAVAPLVLLATVGVGLTVIAATRYVSAGSCVMGLALPIFALILHESNVTVIGLSVLIGGFIIYRHRSNLRRLARGEEAKLFSKKFAQPAETSAMDDAPGEELR